MNPEHPADAEALNRAGIQAAEQGELESAVRFWREALALDESAPLHFNLGVILSQLNRPEEALAHYRKAVSLAPENAPAWTNLALLLEQRGNFSEAEQCHRKALAAARHSSDILFHLANHLVNHGGPTRFQEARECYLELLRQHPEHAGAWHNLGTLLFDTGYMAAAQTAYTAAITHQPAHLISRVNLGQVMLYRDDLSGAEARFREVLASQPDHPEAHQGLAACLSRSGREAEAAFHRDCGFMSRPLARYPSWKEVSAIPVLVLSTAQEGNIPWRFLLDRQHFDFTSLAVEYWNPQARLPAHALIFNAIGDADRCASALEQAAELIRQSNAKVINDPARILKTGRMMQAATLGRLPHIRVVQPQLLPRPQLVDRLHGLAFPLLLRSPGFHGGQFMERVDEPGQLPAAIDRLPGDTLLVMEYLPYQSADGLFRKYRVMMVDGQPYPVHLAISDHWKVHYFSSLMTERPDLRTEEKNFLDDPEKHLGHEVLNTLRHASREIGLDYFGLDFNVTPEGEVLVFEANATMVLQPVSGESIWDYRKPAVQRAMSAVQALFIRCCGDGT